MLLENLLELCAGIYYANIINYYDNLQMQTKKRVGGTLFILCCNDEYLKKFSKIRGIEIFVEES